MQGYASRFVNGFTFLNRKNLENTILRYFPNFLSAFPDALSKRRRREFEPSLPSRKLPKERRFEDFIYKSAPKGVLIKTLFHSSFSL